jgi:hypothetical protein
MSRLAGELDQEKSNAEDLVYSEKNRRNSRLKMKDISLDVSLVSSWNIQTTIGKDPQYREKKTWKIPTYIGALTEEEIAYGY